MSSPPPPLSASDDDDFVWSFGFGSNMNIDIVTKKKGVAVLEYTAGSVSGYSLSFTTGGLSSVEPSFGDCQPQSGGEIHGVALKLTKEDMNAMDAQEGYNPNSTKGYKKIEVTVNAYDGRTFLAWVYSARQPKPVSTHCSQRYLNVLVSGAKDAGLDPEYIEKLSKLPTYTPTPETLALRSKVRALEGVSATSSDCDISDHNGYPFVTVTRNVSLFRYLHH